MADPFDTPGYRFALNRYPGNGVTTQWDIAFAGVSPGYISQEHVTAYMVNNTTAAETPIILTPANFILPTRLQITPAVPAGYTLVIRRNTPKDKPLLDYNDGALMIEKNLDTSNLQNVYAVAEMVDRYADSLADVQAFTLAVLDRLADVEAEANTATATASTAISTANSALSASAAAVTTANNALAGVEGATEAALLATEAADNANAAATLATDAALAAETTSAAALSTAENAETVALGIAGTANTALTNANEALDTANDAASTVGGFDSRIIGLETITYPTPLPATAHNLNDYNVMGRYYQNTNSGALAGTNYPVGIAGHLNVFKAGTNVLVQEYTTYPDGGVTRKFWRSFGASWSAWVEAASVAALTTGLSGKLSTAAFGVPNGVATLNASGQVPSAQNHLTGPFATLNTTVSNLSSTVSAQGSALNSAAGIGQTQQNVAAGRALGTVYTNNTGRPIWVTVQGTLTTAGGNIFGTIGGVICQRSYMATTGAKAAIQFMVPNAYSFQVDAPGCTIDYWYEYRT